jgi:hypothetical protein
MKISKWSFAGIMLIPFIMGCIIGYNVQGIYKYKEMQKISKVPSSAQSTAAQKPSKQSATEGQRGRVPIEVKAAAFNNSSSALIAFYKDPETSRIFRYRDLRDFGNKNALFFKYEGNMAPAEKKELLELLADKSYGILQASAYIFTDPIAMDVTAKQYESEFTERVKALLGEEAAARYFDYEANATPWKLLDKFTGNLDYDCPSLSTEQNTAILAILREKKITDIVDAKAEIAGQLTPDQIPYYEAYLENEIMVRRVRELDREVASKYLTQTGGVPSKPRK